MPITSYCGCVIPTAWNFADRVLNQAINQFRRIVVLLVWVLRTSDSEFAKYVASHGIQMTGTGNQAWVIFPASHLHYLCLKRAALWDAQLSRYLLVIFLPLTILLQALLGYGLISVSKPQLSIFIITPHIDLRVHCLCLLLRIHTLQLYSI